MGGFLGRIAGAKGCNMQDGSGTITAPSGAKITGIGVHEAAEITNYKHTPRSNSGTLSQVTVTGKGWMGAVIGATAVTAYIPLEHPADSVTIASGVVFVYFD